MSPAAAFPNASHSDADGDCHSDYLSDGYTDGERLSPLSARMQHTYPNAKRNRLANCAAYAYSNANSYPFACPTSGVEYLDAAAR